MGIKDVIPQIVIVVVSTRSPPYALRHVEDVVNTTLGLPRFLTRFPEYLEEHRGLYCNDRDDNQQLNTVKLRPHFACGAPFKTCQVGLSIPKPALVITFRRLLSSALGIDSAI